MALGAAPARPALAAASPAEARERARLILEDPELQGSLPEQLRGGTEKPEEISQEPLSGRDRSERDEPPPVQASSSLASLFVYLLVGAAVILLVVWILTESAERRKKEEAGVPRAGGEGEAELEGRDLALDDATRLAGEARYGEAMHVLLLVAIHQVAERSRATLPPSRTSRELVRLLPLGADSREAFGEMVRGVELTLFGGVPAEAEDYRRSVESFRLVTGGRTA
jgi:hypothetical protein